MKKLLFVLVPFLLLSCGKKDEAQATVPQPQPQPCSAPKADAGRDLDLVYGMNLPSSVQLGSPAKEGESYQWSPADGLDKVDVAQPIAAPQCSHQYTLTVSNACGKDSAKVWVRVFIENLDTGARMESWCR